jgi:hypothetical protein
MRGMLYIIAVILIVIWLLGMISDLMIGGYIHLFLLAAVIMIVLQMAHGRRKLKHKNH